MLLILFVFALSPLTISAVHDETVYQAQRRLNELGYNPGPIDGFWGNKTQKAVKDFQRDNGLSVTGNIDKATIKKLGIEARKESKKPKATGLSEKYLMTLTLMLQIDAGIQNEVIEGKLEPVAGHKGAYTMMYPSVFNGIVIDPDLLKNYGFSEVTKGDKVEIRDLGNQKYRIKVQVIRTGESKTVNLDPN